MDFKAWFPFPKIREQQQQSLDFIVNNIKEKRFIILEISTGGGKSGIAVALSRWIKDHYDSPSIPGSYIITTQKILQEQYTRDFPEINNIWSKSNYSCLHRKKISCEEGHLLDSFFGNSKKNKSCDSKCHYKKELSHFINGSIGLTNIAFMLNQIAYNDQFSGLRRQLMIIDECHNLEQSIVDFISTRIDKEHCEIDLSIPYPSIDKDLDNTRKWLEEVYIVGIQFKINEIKNRLLEIGKETSEAKSLTKQYTYLDKRMCKTNRFLLKYQSKHWVVSAEEDFFEVKPIYASNYTEDCIFKMADKILLMSGTILDHETFCNHNGIPIEQSCFLSLDSPFKVENRQVMICPVGSMSYKNIEETLPSMNNAIQKIISDTHKGQKGIIHTNSYKVAKYLKLHDRSGRMMLHTSKNRREVYDEHINSKEDSILISPSFTEGIDLRYDLSRFQIICKIPYPYLQDDYVLIKMKRCKNWYEWMTVKTIIQCLGRSIRSEDDYAISYVLDSDWERLYCKSNYLFPDWFKKALIFV